MWQTHLGTQILPLVMRYHAVHRISPGFRVTNDVCMCLKCSNKHPQTTLYQPWAGTLEKSSFKPKNIRCSSCTPQPKGMTWGLVCRMHMLTVIYVEEYIQLPLRVSSTNSLSFPPFSQSRPSTPLPTRQRLLPPPPPRPTARSTRSSSNAHPHHHRPTPPQSTPTPPQSTPTTTPILKPR